MPTSEYTLFSGGAPGTEAEFGHMAEKYGLQEVTFTFEGHKVEHSRGLRFLTAEELKRKDVSLSYVSRLLNRTFTNAPLMRSILQTIMYQVDSANEIYVIGTIMDDNTVKGGTGWGTEFAKICNKPLYTYDQNRNSWHTWTDGNWARCETPAITHKHFCGTGTRFLEANGKQAIADLFAKSFS